MDTEMIKELERKYWNAETTCEEEAILRNIAQNNPEKVSEEMRAVAAYTEEYEAAELDGEFDEAILRKMEFSESASTRTYWLKMAAAAAILILIAVGGWQYFQNEVPDTDQTLAGMSDVVDTYEDPELALEEAKQALAYASGIFRKGIEPIEKLEKFSQSKKLISQDLKPYNNDTLQ